MTASTTHTLLSHLTLLLLTALTDAAKPCGGTDLPTTAPLHIKVVSKPADCKKTTANGERLKMHYTGVLFSSCKQFDSSVGREPFEFTLGAREVIRGWDDGLVGMCVGEKRKLVIPADLGYGAGGAGDDIPGGATLQFDVELLEINT